MISGCLTDYRLCFCVTDRKLELQMIIECVIDIRIYTLKTI